MHKRIHRRHQLALKVAAIVGIVIVFKLITHRLGWEIISLNPLFSGIVAADLFLMGFLLTGMLSDYKESESLPGELATSLESIIKEVSTIQKNKNAQAAKDCLTHLYDLTVSIKSWFYKRERTKDVMERLSGLSRFFSDLEPLTQATFIARLKQEQANIRRIMTRFHTIRETSFASSGYMIAEMTTVLLTLHLIFSKIDPFYESLFFLWVITFLLTFLDIAYKRLGQSLWLL